MEKKILVVCIIVGTLGIISAISGFAAESHRIKESDVRVIDWQCVYPSSPSTGLGVVGAVALAFARIILSVAGGWCSCCRNNPKYSATISCTARLCSILSWLASVVAMFLLLAGAAIANRQGGELRSDGTLMCYYVKPGVFAGGAIMDLSSVVLGTIFYIILSSAKQNASGGTLPDDIEKPPIAPTKTPRRAPTAPIEMNFAPASVSRY